MLCRTTLLLLCTAVAGCATSHRDRAWLGREIEERTGAATRAGATDELPAGVNVGDGVDEAEVVSLALWRNPALRAEMARIDAAMATLDEASRPANPQLTVMGPIGPISAVATLLVPLESLWQMPSRTKAAAREADAAGEAVLMRALDIVRDARLAHVELGLALDRAAVREELAKVASELARIAAARASVGETGPLEERVLMADATTAADASDSAGTEVAIARARLFAQLALDAPTGARATFATEVTAAPALPALLEIARAARPDARSAALAIEAATARADWESARVFSLAAIVEGHWSQKDGPAMRVGGRADLLLFGPNPGGPGRAEAEIERLTALHEVVARTVVLEVSVAHARLEQATRSRKRFEEQVLPALDEALQSATESFEAGDTTYVAVLDVLRRVGEARIRRAEIVADQRRALSELDRALGARLDRAPGVAERGRRERGAE